jgi:hypothetical protein
MDSSMESKCGIFLKDYTFVGTIGEDCLGRKAPQSIVVNCAVAVVLDERKDITTVTGSIRLRKALDGVVAHEFKDFYDFLQSAHNAIAETMKTKDSYIELRFPKGLMYSTGGIGVRSIGNLHGVQRITALSVNNICLPCVLGGEEGEMPTKQAIVANFAVFFLGREIPWRTRQFSSLFGDIVSVCSLIDKLFKLR